MTSTREAVARLIDVAPNAPLQLADFYAWFGPNITGTIHAQDCPRTEPEWFDPKRSDAPKVVRSLPEGMVVCATCTAMVLRRYAPQTS